jgi:mono/diheme cytochrome c family protein
MRSWSRFAVCSVVLLAAAAATSALSCAPASQTSAEPAAMTVEQKLARGRYLLSVLGCNDCHTPGMLFGAPDTTRTLAGSEIGWVGPWGISFARNLTPDSTGIGSWTEEQFVTAIREGRRPDGSALLPPMPWPNTAHLTDEDAYALAAYVRSLPPVRHEVPSALPPGRTYAGPIIPFPAPGEWDAPKPPAPAGTP